MKEWSKKQKTFLDERVYSKYPTKKFDGEIEDSAKYRALIEFMEQEQGRKGFVWIMGKRPSESETVELETDAKVKLLEEEVLRTTGILEE
jgi:hypothetical protein